jgi:hypothetical protein
MQQHERSRDGPHHDERAQAEGGGPQQAGGGRIGAPQREQMR